jgi:hypothetical protein
MRNIKWAVAVAAMVAGLLASSLAAAGVANAGTYSISGIDRCASVGSFGTPRCFELGAYDTFTQNQVWINGNVWCHGYTAGMGIGWHGVGGGNGTGALNIGCNFTMADANGGFYERMDLFAGGSTDFGGDGPGCHAWGSNSPGNGVNHWWNDGGAPTFGDGDGGLHPGVTCEKPV